MTVLSLPVRCVNAPRSFQPVSSRISTASSSVATKRSMPAAWTSRVTCRCTDISDLRSDARGVRGVNDIPTQVPGDHVLVAQLGRFAGEAQPTLVEHADVVADLERLGHVLFDEQQRCALLGQPPTA